MTNEEFIKEINFLKTELEKTKNELIYEFYQTNDNSHDNICKKILKLFCRNTHKNDAMISYIRYWVKDREAVHSKTRINYGNLLSRVWILIKNHQQKEDFIINVKIELESSKDVCFTGRINRLVNSLVGFIDGVNVGISLKEQLQLEIGKIIAKLGKGEISYKDCKKTITELFDDADVKEDETITSYYKQSWLDALDDYKPDDEQ